MKKTLKFFGIIALIAIIGLSIVACGSGGDDNDIFAGTWMGTGGEKDLKLVAKNGSFKQYLTSDNTEVIRGKYKVSGNTVTATIKDVNTVLFGVGDNWVKYSSLDEVIKGYVGKETQKLTISDNKFTNMGMTFTKQ